MLEGEPNYQGINPKLPDFTPLEEGILSMIASGFTNEEIARLSPVVPNRGLPYMTAQRIILEDHIVPHSWTVNGFSADHLPLLVNDWKSIFRTVTPNEAEDEDFEGAATDASDHWRMIHFARQPEIQQFFQRFTTIVCSGKEPTDEETTELLRLMKLVFPKFEIPEQK